MFSSYNSGKPISLGSCGPCGIKGSCAKKSKYSKSYDITYINKLPFAIEKSGKYVVEVGLMKYNAKKDPCGKVAITIAKKGKFKGGVYLDLSGAVIDMRKGAGTSILIDGVEDVTIVNGKFRNSGDPGDVPTSGAIPETVLGAVLPLDVSTAQPAQQYTLEEIVSTYPTSYVWVNAVDPYSGVAIAIHASSGIIIQNCNFDHMFIGIAGICTSSDPKNLDISKNITIRNCTGSECGFVKPNVSYYAENDSLPQVLRGAFIAFQSQNFLGPTQAAPFYCGNINIVTGVMDNTAELPKCFQGITIEGCNSSSEVAQAGVFLNYTNSCVVRDCDMQLMANYNISIPVDQLNFGDAYLVNASAPYLGYFNHAVHITNCSGQGGYDTFYFQFDMNVMIDQCTAQYHYSTGILMLYEQYPVVSNCKISEGLDLGLPISYTGGIPTIILGCGYALQLLVSYMGLVETTSMSNYRAVSQIQTSTNFYSQYNNYQDAAGLTYSYSSYCIVRGNNVFNNGVGMGADFVCDHCTIQDNTVWANGTDVAPANVAENGSFCGLYNVFSVGLPGDPLRFNKFMGNRLMNNGQYGNTNVFGGTPGTPYFEIGCPYLVTAPFQNPNMNLPINANIQETPSIVLTSNYDYSPAGLAAGLQILMSLFAHVVFQADTLVMFCYTWQGVASSTVPIISYTLTTPARGELSPDSVPVVPGQISFTLDNVQPSDVGLYYVTVEFDIGTLPLPALHHYRSNAYTIELVTPIPI